MLEILIVDAELQLVPAEMHGDKQIRKLAIESCSVILFISFLRMKVTIPPPPESFFEVFS